MAHMKGNMAFEKGNITLIKDNMALTKGSMALRNVRKSWMKHCKSTDQLYSDGSQCFKRGMVQTIIRGTLSFMKCTWFEHFQSLSPQLEFGIIRHHVISVNRRHNTNDWALARCFTIRFNQLIWPGWGESKVMIVQKDMVWSIYPKGNIGLTKSNMAPTKSSIALTKYSMAPRHVRNG